MILPVHEQLYYFAIYIAVGLIIGILFDTYRIIRGFDCPGKIMTIVSDILFWIFAAVVIFIFMLYTNSAYLRYNIFIGLLIGLITYFKILSRSFLKILKWIIYYLLKFFRMLIIFVMYPIKLVRYFFGFVIFKGRDAAKKGYVKSKNYAKKIKLPHKIKKEKKDS